MVQRYKSQSSFQDVVFHKHRLPDEEDLHRAFKTITTDMGVEDHQVPIGHHQWVVTEVAEDVGDHLHHEEDGEEGAGVVAGEGGEVETLDIGHAHTRDLGAGRQGGTCHDHPVADPCQERRRVVEAVVGVMGGETHHREEEEGVVAEGEGAQVTILMTVHGLGAGAETAGRPIHLSRQDTRKTKKKSKKSKLAA